MAIRSPSAQEFVRQVVLMPKSYLFIGLIGLSGCNLASLGPSKAPLAPIPHYVYYALEDRNRKWFIVPLPEAAVPKPGPTDDSYDFFMPNSSLLSISPSATMGPEVNGPDMFAKTNAKNIFRNTDGSLAILRVEEGFTRQPQGYDKRKSTTGILMWSREKAAIGVLLTGTVPVSEAESTLRTIQKGIAYDESLSSANQVAKRFGAKVKILTYNR
ncbi:MAG: hypothetical protein JST40_02925 [Armatimonadetes bacterium]|nr:hypothetical protein [Armatimonadota bacterium]